MKKEQGDDELPCGVGKHEWEEDSKLKLCNRNGDKQQTNEREREREKNLNICVR
jgi:hypothetical protein